MYMAWRLSQYLWAQCLFYEHGPSVSPAPGGGGEFRDDSELGLKDRKAVTAHGFLLACSESHVVGDVQNEEHNTQ